MRKLFAAANIRTQSLPFTTGATGILFSVGIVLSFPSFGTTRMTAPLADLTRRTGVNALLWSAGNLLTTGGFLAYFVREYRPPGMVLAALLVVPETAAILGLATPWFVARAGDRRRVWWIGQIVARVLMLCVPVACATLGPRSPAVAGWVAVAWWEPLPSRRASASTPCFLGWPIWLHANVGADFSPPAK